MTVTTDETAAARALAEHLMKPGGYSGNSPSPLEVRVRRGIGELADQVVREVIAAHPELHELIRRRVVAVVAAALRDDEMLSKTVTAAVAAGLGALVADRQVT